MHLICLKPCNISYYPLGYAICTCHSYPPASECRGATITTATKYVWNHSKKSCTCCTCVIWQYSSINLRLATSYTIMKPYEYSSRSCVTHCFPIIIAAHLQKRFYSLFHYCRIPIVIDVYAVKIISFGYLHYKYTKIAQNLIALRMLKTYFIHLCMIQSHLTWLTRSQQRHHNPQLGFLWREDLVCPSRRPQCKTHQ